MNQKDDGGPAFPLHIHEPHGNFANDKRLPGLLLRDWFAAHAPVVTIEAAAKLLGWPLDLPMGDGDEDEEEYEEPKDTKFSRWKAMPAEAQLAVEAQWAFLYADSMIRERSKQ